MYLFPPDYYLALMDIVNRLADLAETENWDECDAQGLAQEAYDLRKEAQNERT